MGRIHQEREKYSNYLKASGVKLTAARTAVFDEAMHAHGHFCAEDLVKRCREGRSDKAVSRASVYRSLKELLAAGIIRATAYGEKHQNYEHIYDEKLHHHARCIQCHAIHELPDLQEDQIYRPLLQKEGFKILGHELHFYGLCANCAPA